MIKIWQLAVGSYLAVSNLAVVYGIPYAKVLLYVYSNDTLIVRGFGGFFLEVSYFIMYFFSQRLNQIEYLLQVIPVLICLYKKTSELNYVYTNNFIIQNIVYSSQIYFLPGSILHFRCAKM